VRCGTPQCAVALAHEKSLSQRGHLWHPARRMDPQAKLAAAQALLGIVLLSFVPVVLLTLLAPLRDARQGGKRG